MIRDRLGKELLFFDGGMGTLLQAEGLQPGELPETWNVKKREKIIDIHRAYLEAGSDIVLTNTFGANPLKYKDDSYSLETVIYAAVENVREAARLANRELGTYAVALDMGPTGKLLAPSGELSFEEAYQAFLRTAELGMEAGADLIHIETMSDTYEVKAAVLAAKETGLPVFATMIFDEKGKLLTGADAETVVALLEGLRVDALGMNCGMGPKQMLPILKELRAYTSLPIIVKPNAGLPKQRAGETYYDVDPKEFAETMLEIVSEGACVIGGCCGTTPEHILTMTELCSGRKILPVEKKDRTVVSSYGKSVEIGNGPVIIGERINPTGKKRFKQALQERDMDYLLKEAVAQQEHGAHILDVNVGLPDIDEVSLMKEAVQRIQEVTSLPLQIDTVNRTALEQAMRIYNGKPMVNSVTGKQDSLDAVLPLIQKYGGVVVGLTLDEDGIPKSAEGRLAIARKIIEEAALYGIEKKDIVIDVLAMTISSEPEGARTTLEALRLVSEELGVKTVLGVSNISFGLPNRPAINANFYTMAMQNGLSAAIINPLSEEMMKSFFAFSALMGYDNNCEKYIRHYSDREDRTSKPLQQAEERISLESAVIKGLREETVQIAKNLLKEKEPLEIIDQSLIPALDQVGKGFEAGTVFLPQLLMSAEAAKGAFQVIKEALQSSGKSEEKKDKIILATVKGDIHDIGKNIVKVLLENYSFDVIDLGKDVPPEVVVEKALEEHVMLIGLSALMTTTVVSMEETIKLVREKLPGCKVMVGGAVLNQEYADMIGADFYGKDAMQSVYFAQKVFQHKGGNE